MSSDPYLYSYFTYLTHNIIHRVTFNVFFNCIKLKTFLVLFSFPLYSSDLYYIHPFTIFTFSKPYLSPLLHVLCLSLLSDKSFHREMAGVCVKMMKILMIIAMAMNIAMSDPIAPCYFIFGDSLVDSGNNNRLSSLARADYFPYGIDFPFGPTGRFCNGKTTVDVISNLITKPLLLLYNWTNKITNFFSVFICMR